MKGILRSIVVHVAGQFFNLHLVLRGRCKNDIPLFADMYASFFIFSILGISWSELYYGGKETRVYCLACENVQTTFVTLMYKHVRVPTLFRSLCLKHA